MLKCARCGTNNAPTNPNCIGCGASLSAGAPPGGPPPGGFGGGYPPPGYPGAGGPPPGAPPGGYGPPPGAPGGMPPAGPGPQAGPPPGMPPGGYPGQYQGGPPPGAPGQYPGGPPPGAGPGGPPPGGAPGGPPHGYGPPPGGPGSYGATPPGTPAAMSGPGPQQGSPAAGQAAPAAAPGTNTGKLAGFLLSYDIEPRGTFWPLRVGANKVGRKGASEALDIAIDHPTVSSNHALIQVEADAALAQIEDQRSANGTLLHQKTIAGQGRRELRDGDVVRFGAVNVVIKLVDPS